MPLFDRKVELLLGSGEAIRVKDLRVSFNVNKTAAPETNSCQVSVWNLNPDQRAMLERAEGTMVLKAGYALDSGPEVLYIGDIAVVQSERQPPDVVTTISGEDGFQAMSETRVSLSYKEGTGAKQILQDVLKQFNLATRSTIQAVLAQIPDTQFANGFSATGQAKDVLVKLTSTLSLEWSVQNHEIKVLKKGGSDDAASVALSPESGLIGSPERRSETGDGKMRYNGWRVRCLLQPKIEPAGTVILRAKDVDSSFRVESVAHSGDTHGGQWESLLEITDL